MNTATGTFRVPTPISLLEISRKLKRLYRKENSSRQRLQVLLCYSDEYFSEDPNSVFAAKFRNRNRIPIHPTGVTARDSRKRSSLKNSRETANIISRADRSLVRSRNKVYWSSFPAWQSLEFSTC